VLDTVNVGKRNRKNKKRLNKVSYKANEPINESKNDMNENYKYKRMYSFNDESDSDCTEEITVRGRCTRVKICFESSENKSETNNFIINYDSDINDSSMFDSDSNFRIKKHLPFLLFLDFKNLFLNLSLLLI